MTKICGHYSDNCPCPTHPVPPQSECVFDCENCRQKEREKSQLEAGLKAFDLTAKDLMKTIKKPPAPKSGEKVRYQTSKEEVERLGKAFTVQSDKPAPKEECKGNCKELIPKDHKGAYTESTRTVFHHPEGICHYVGWEDCVECFKAPHTAGSEEWKGKVFNIVAKLDNGSHSANQLQGIDEAITALIQKLLQTAREEWEKGN